MDSFSRKFQYVLPAPLVDLPLVSSTCCCCCSSRETRAAFLLSPSAVLFAVPAVNTDFGKEGIWRRVALLPLPFTASSHDSSSRCLMVLFFTPPRPLLLLSVCLPPGLELESLVHRKRAGKGSCDDLHREVFCVKKAEFPWWKKGFKGFWHILTFNMKEEPMLGYKTTGLVRI